MLVQGLNSKIFKFLLMKFSLSFFLLVLVTNMSFAQKHVSQIKVGEKMPEEIQLGGYNEKAVEDCRCRLFQIRDTELRIYYSKMDTVTAVQKLKSAENFQEALNSYVHDMTHYMKAFGFSCPEDFELLKVRDTDKKHRRDAKYYFTYRDKETDVYTSIGIFGVFLIEERYLKNSKYNPTLVD